MKLNFIIGQTVRVRGTDLVAVVTAVLIRCNEYQTCELSYIHNGDQKIIWVEDWRLEDAE